MRNRVSALHTVVIYRRSTLSVAQHHFCHFLPNGILSARLTFEIYAGVADLTHKIAYPKLELLLVA